MSAMIFGQPWHGRLTPTGLVLADGSTKTTMAGTDATGQPKTFSYTYQGAENTGSTYYVKTPNQPLAATPAAIAALGGEFKNDAVLFGYGKRYTPFGGLDIDYRRWLHYGADGVWRKFSIVVSDISNISHVVKVYRWPAFGQIGADTVAQSGTLIATFTLTHAAPFGYQSAIFPDLDARYDGRQIVVTRWDYMTQIGGDSLTDGKWLDESQRGIVAAWRIDIAADGATATATVIWETAIGVRDENVEKPPSLFTSPGVYYTVSGITKEFWEDYEGDAYGSYGYVYTATRLVGIAYAPDGTLHLIKWSYRRNVPVTHYHVTGSVSRGSTTAEPPVLPAPSFPRSVNPIYSTSKPHTSVRMDVESYEIDIRSNTTLLKTLLPGDTWPIWSVQKTNNVFDVRNSTESIARFGPGAIDATASSLSPLYASYNPRSNVVETSANPIGFV